MVLAGGRSSRFGSDKAVALLQGRSLLEHAMAALSAHAQYQVIAGREFDGLPHVADHPAPGLGPLGGLCGGLRFARDQGYDRVLSCGVDSPDVPLGVLKHAPCYLAAQPIVGLWPVAAREALERFLKEDTRRSVRGFAERIGASAIRVGTEPSNINTPADLAQVEQARRE